MTPVFDAHSQTLVWLFDKGFSNHAPKPMSESCLRSTHKGPWVDSSSTRQKATQVAKGFLDKPIPGGYDANPAHLGRLRVVQTTLPGTTKDV